MKKLLFLFLISFVAKGFSQTFWQAKSTGFANVRGVSDISIADADNVWMQAYDGTTPTNEIREFARSIDGGLNWTTGLIGIPSTATITSFKAISGTTCFVGANGFGLYKTSDGGLNWSLTTTGLFSGSTSFFDFGAFVSPTTGVVVGDPLGGYMEIYRTTDGGDTWGSRISSANIAAIVPGEYAFTNSYSQFGNAIYFFTNKARTFRSLDAGLTWNVYANPFTGTSLDTSPGGKFCLKSELEGIYYNTANYQYWKTVNGGVSFVEIIPLGVLRANDITFVPGTVDAYIAIGNDVDLSARGTSYSCDGGINWEDINLLGDVKNVDGGSSVTFFSPTIGFASGFSTSSSVNGIFKYVGPVIGLPGSVCDNLSSAQFLTDKQFILSPNPTSGKFNLAGANITQVQVIDVLGKVIINNNYASLSSIDINLENTNSGIYIVKITNDAGITSVMKVIKQ